MRVLVIDNYDSFTYNLVQYLGELGAELDVVRNDRAGVDELLERAPDRVVVSPGPCTPAQAGISVEAMARFPAAGIPTLGVCLGHQALAAAFGGSVVRHHPVHGKTGVIEHDGRTIFARPAQPADGRPLPLADRRRRRSPTASRCSARGRGRRDGDPPPRAARRGRAVPPRVGAHRGGHGAAGELPGGDDARPRARWSRRRSTPSPRDGTSAPTGAAAVLAEIMNGDVPDAQIAGLLIALRTKGETVEELAGLARAMRALAVPVRARAGELLDTAGTGGGRRSFNVSTTAALIAAGAGCAVAKHGNRSATSLSGSADVLEALGARIDLDAAGVARCIDEAGFGFMFAPAHHQATRFVIARAPRARRAHDLQLPRSADQPGRRAAPARRRLRRALPGDDRRRARPARRRARARRRRRGRPRRGLGERADARRRGQRRRRPRLHGHARAARRRRRHAGRPRRRDARAQRRA